LLALQPFLTLDALLALQPLLTLDALKSGFAGDSIQSWQACRTL